jgi:polyketide cyclase/dehydrase/lipid transport protein
MGFVDAPAEVVFGFLSDLGNHWQLAERFVEVVGVEGRGGVGDGGWVRLRGPLLLRRTARTHLLAASPPRQLTGSAEIGHQTQAILRWTLWPRGQAAAVRLSATVESLGLLDRLLLAAGGDRWLRRRFAGAVGRLADRFDPSTKTSGQSASGAAVSACGAPASAR